MHSVKRLLSKDTDDGSRSDRQKSEDRHESEDRHYSDTTRQSSDNVRRSSEDLDKDRGTSTRGRRQHTLQR
jgi:hypothetical protein